MCGCGGGPPKRGSGGLCGGGGCPQWPDKCCLCFSRTGGVVITGILTILDNVCIILLCAYAIVDKDFWAEGKTTKCLSAIFTNCTRIKEMPKKWAKGVYVHPLTRQKE